MKLTKINEFEGSKPFCLSPDGEYLAYIFQLNIIIYSLKFNKVKYRVFIPTSSICFSNKSDKLAIYSGDEIYLLNIIDNDEELELNQFSKNLYKLIIKDKIPNCSDFLVDMCFSNDDKYLIHSPEDMKFVILIDLEKSKLETLFYVNNAQIFNGISAISYISSIDILETRLIACTSDVYESNILLYDYKLKKKVYEPLVVDNSSNVLFFKNSNTIIFITNNEANEQKLIIYNFLNQKFEFEYPLEKTAYSISIDKKNNYLFMIVYDSLHKSKLLRVFCLNTKSVIYEIEIGNFQYIKSTNYLEDTLILLGSLHINKIELWKF